MSEQLSIILSKPIKSVNILDYQQKPIEPDSNHITSETVLKQTDSSNDFIRKQDMEHQKSELSQVCQTLQCVTEKLQNFYDKIFMEHQEQIARLSVEIARKILSQKVEKGDYEIETLIKEVLSKSPTRHDIDIHLNPEDLTNLQNTLQDKPLFAGIIFTSNPNVGRAECFLKSPKGNIESSINEHLEQIYEVLKKA
jgi:flagellar biosynthesis/type III secretory pathway protein FliH